MIGDFLSGRIVSAILFEVNQYQVFLAIVGCININIIRKRQTAGLVKQLQVKLALGCDRCRTQYEFKTRPAIVCADAADCNNVYGFTII